MKKNKTKDDWLDLIKARRSVRKFKPVKISLQKINKGLEAARWAPSGLNNQPWKFQVIGGQKKIRLAELTKYSNLVKEADKLILVFLDLRCSYHYKKDLMAVGAAIENLLLYFHSQGLGACWLGEILKNSNLIVKELKIKPQLELAAVIALGVPEKIPASVSRKPLRQLIIPNPK